MERSNLRGYAGTFGFYLLCFFLMFYGAVGLAGLAIPAWVGFVLAFVAGLLLLVGR